MDFHDSMHFVKYISYYLFFHTIQWIVSAANVILVLVGDFTFNWSLGAVTDGAKNSKNTQI